uniref:Integrase, catalytic region, zinc finger, CCHC-type, peptidase aspartic, catalytic n=1 Tax=Tanacetum cinerariifolium TaxID=118510 RepID=A0A6L2MU12_TANCI|nr:integrase, catalytic region, zinc finger, CCHC-type, peptidase aspartic, catalytic [Tanacetum cinerariifolium]
MLLCKQREAGIQLNAEQADWIDDTDDDELEDQELEAHYMYMAQLQEVSPDAVDSGPIFDDEPVQKVSNDDHYNVFAMESIHPEQSKSTHDTYLIEQDAQNVIIDSLDMNYDREEIDKNDDDNDLAKEREIEDFKNKNKSLESSNNFFKEANNKLSETNNLLYADYKKSEAELARRNSKEYASKMELECAKEMVADLRYFNSLELEVDSLRSQLENQKTQFLNEIDRRSREYYYVDHMNAILGVYTELDEVTNLQCDYLKLLEKCEGLETELSKCTMMSKSFELVQKHAINLELELQQCKEKIKNDMLFKTLPSNNKSILKKTNVLAPGMYKIHTDHNQTRTSQLPQNSRKTNKRVSFSTRVIPITSVSRSQLKSNPQGDRVLRNSSQGKKQEVEDQRRNVKLSKNKTSVTACNGSLNAKTLNVKYVSAMCDKCVLIDKHDMCVLNSVAKPIKRTVALESNKKPRNFTTKLYEHVSKTCSWWYSKFTPSRYKWKPKSETKNVNLHVSMPLGNASRTANVMDTMTSRRSTVSNTPLSSNSFTAHRDCPIHRTVKFRNDQIAPILGYGDLVQGDVEIKKVYYVEGLNHNLFSVGQFCDADLEVAFRKSTCFIRDLKGNDLVTGMESIFETTSQLDVPTPTSVDPLPITTPTMTSSTIAITTTTSQAPILPTTVSSDIIQNLPNFGSVFCFDDRLREFDEFLRTVDENIKKIIKEQVKEQVKVQVSKILPRTEQAVNEQLEAKVLTRSSHSSRTSYSIAADLFEMELKKILIEKIEGNKSIQRSDEQRNLFKALVEAYESDKLILDTYGETVTLKRRRGDDAASAPTKTATRSAGRFIQGSRSKQASTSESALADEPMQTTSQMEEPSHPKFDIELLAGPTYDLMKGSCKSLIELEYHLEEVYKATTDQLD